MNELLQRTMKMNDKMAMYDRASTMQLNAHTKRLDALETAVGALADAVQSIGIDDAAKYPLSAELDDKGMLHILIAGMDSGLCIGLDSKCGLIVSMCETTRLARHEAV